MAARQEGLPLVVPTVAECRTLANYQLWVRFTDGAEGIADLSNLCIRGPFEEWADPEFFARATINPTSQSVVWPGGIDLDPWLIRRLAIGEAPFEGNAPAAPRSGPMSPIGRAMLRLLVMSASLAALYLLTLARVNGSGWIIYAVLFVAAIAGEGWRRSRLRYAGECPKCKYSLKGLSPDVSGRIRCPECGTSTNTQP